jgi:glycosyltransferase involved in cell wall biosynthesis
MLALDMPEKQTDPHGPKKPCVLAVLPGIIPSTSILVIKPLLQLFYSGEVDAKITLESRVTQGQMKWADVVMLCRNTEPRYGHILNFLRRNAIPYIYDIDDNFFELPQDTEIGSYHRRPDRIALLREYLRSAELVRVYSQPMLERARTISPNVVSELGPVDLAQIRAGRKRKKNRKCIVYCTSSYPNSLAPFLLKAVESVLKRFADKAEFHFWGMHSTSIPANSNVYHHGFVMNYDRFLRKFSDAQYDIGLAPMYDDPFHRSKTNNKFREYGACGIAGIYSDVEIYSRCVQDGETGLLVPNDPDSWFRAMKRLIEEEELCSRIKTRSRTYVAENYSQARFEKRLLECIQTIAENRKAPALKAVFFGLSPKCDAGSRKSGIVRAFEKLRSQAQTMRGKPLSLCFQPVRRAAFVQCALIRFRIATSSFVSRLLLWEGFGKKIGANKKSNR